MEEEILDIKRENYKLRKENFELTQDNVKLQEEKNLLDYRRKEEILKRAREYEKLKSDLEYVLEQVLGAYQHNWCIDWNFTEIREKYKLDNKNI